MGITFPVIRGWIDHDAFHRDSSSIAFSDKSFRDCSSWEQLFHAHKGRPANAELNRKPFSGSFGPCTRNP